MELDHLVLADVISPRPDGKLDLHGVGWDTIYAAAVPAQHPRMDVAIRFLLSKQELEVGHRVVMELQGADGQQIARVEAEMQPMPEEEREKIQAGQRVGLGMILNLAGLVFPQFGDYQLVVTWDGTEVRSPMRLFVRPLSFPPQLQ
jgi:hypothetical protein